MSGFDDTRDAVWAALAAYSGTTDLFAQKITKDDAQQCDGVTPRPYSLPAVAVFHRGGAFAHTLTGRQYEVPVTILVQLWTRGHDQESAEAVLLPTLTALTSDNTMGFAHSHKWTLNPTELRDGDYAVAVTRTDLTFVFPACFQL